VATTTPIKVLVTGDSTAAIAAFDGLDSKIGGFLGGNLLKIGGVIAGAFGVEKLFEFGKSSAEAATEFDASMERIVTQAGASQREVDGLKNKVLQMASEVGSAPDKLADGLYHIESAGFRGSQAMDMLKEAAKGAAIGNADLESVTQAMIGVMASGIGGVNGASDAMAILNTTVGIGDMRMQQLSDSIATGVLPTFVTAGLKMNDYSAALATLTDNVTPADEAATRLRMTVSLMEAPSGAAAKALEKIGLTSTSLGTDLRKPNGLLVAVDDLKSHLEKSGLSAVQQAAVIQEAFGGGKTSAGIQTLMQESDRLKDKYDELGDSTSRAAAFEDSWNKTNETTAQKVSDLKDRFAAFKVTIGEDLSQAWGKAAAGTMDFITGLSAANGSITSSENGWARFGASVRLFSEDVKSVIDHIRDFAGEIEKWHTPIEVVAGILSIALIPALLAMGVAAVTSGTETIAIWALLQADAVVSAATTVIAQYAIIAGWIAMGAEALVSAASMAAAWLIAIWPIALVVAAVVAVGVAIFLEWDNIKKWTSEAWSATARFVSQGWADITSAVTTGIAAVVGFFERLPGMIVDALVALPMLLVNFYIGAWSLLISAVLDGIAWAIVILIQVPYQFQRALDALGGLLERLAIDAWNLFSSATVAAVEAIVSFVLGLPGRIWNGLLRIGSDLESLATSAWNLFFSSTKSGGDATVSFATGLPGRIGSALARLGGDLASWASSAWSTAGSAFTAGQASIVSFVSSLPGRIIGAVGDTGRLLYNAGQKVVQGLIDGIGSMFSSLAGKMSDAAGIVKNHLPFSPAKVGPLSGDGNPYYSGQSIVRLLGQGMESQTPTLAASVSNVMNTVAFNPSPSAQFSGGGSSSSSVLNSGGVTNNYINAPGAYAEPITEQGIALMLRRTELQKATSVA
jgi:TP901 family phage tail tape measure protein